MSKSWQDELKNNICSIEELKKHIKLTKNEEKALKKVTDIHPMSVTKYYFSLIDKDDKDDPIRKMIIPSANELDLSGSYDPSCEQANTKMPGLQHKYSQTALILSTNRCSAYCRHCFRKRLVGLKNKEVVERFSDAVRYIKKHKEIDNILISGGDPLILPTKIINIFLDLLTQIPHVKYIRFGSRIPTVFPTRIIQDKQLIKLFKKYSTKKKIYVITHFNHPREITAKSVEAIKLLLDANVSLNNQAVLLKDVNDNADVLAQLFNKLIEVEIFPYYLFQCRPVKRVKKHFQVPLKDGYYIFENAKKRIKAHILCKRLKYIMSHRTGKIEIIGILEDKIYFKYHQAKNPKDLGKFFSKKLNSTAAWLDDLK